MPESPLDKLERLARPPIVEVACGIGFDPMPLLDPVLVGGYWSRDDVRRRFPNRAVHPAIEDVQLGGPGFVLTDGPPPQRAWLISEDGAFVVQLQTDRFFLNWRWMGGDYPCFTGPNGVLERALTEFEAIATYIHGVLGMSPEPRRVDVLKIDLLNEGVHWKDASDAGVMVPRLAALLGAEPFEDPDFVVRLGERRADCMVRLTASRVGMAPTRQIRLETQVVRPLHDGEDTRAGLVAAELVADAVFGGLIPKEQRTMRFGEGP